MTIRLSAKHGVNPSLSVCYFCGLDKNEVVLPGRLPGDAEAPRKAVWNKEPCDQCKEYMAQGIIFVGVNGPEVEKQPFANRTGKFCVIKEDAVKRLLKPGEMLSDILSRRAAFVPEDAWTALRLP